MVFPPSAVIPAFAGMTVAWVAVTVLCSSTAAAAPPDPAVTLARLPDGRNLAFRCAGQGTPTVLLESGWGATGLAWSKVIPRVAPTTRVCAYDRAGMGESDPGPLPRDGAAIARDLDEGLRALKIAGPFVVAGHSAGGLYVRLFADRRPADVTGMVFADPSVEFQDARMAAALGPGAGSTAALRSRTAACLAAAEKHELPSVDPRLLRCNAATAVATWRTQLAELDSLWTATSGEIAAGRAKYGAVPLIVLTAGDAYAVVPEPQRTALDRVWAGLHLELAERSTRGARRTVASGHLIPKDNPQAVAEAIGEVVRVARGG